MRLCGYAVMRSNDFQQPIKLVRQSVVFYKYQYIITIVLYPSRYYATTNWVVTFGASLKTKGTMVVGK
jgi:hypothetical protein